MDHFNDIIMRLFKNEVGESAVDDWWQRKRKGRGKSFSNEYHWVPLSLSNFKQNKLKKKKKKKKSNFCWAKRNKRLGLTTIRRDEEPQLEVGNSLSVSIAEKSVTHGRLLYFSHVILYYSIKKHSFSAFWVIIFTGRCQSWTDSLWLCSFALFSTLWPTVI